MPIPFDIATFFFQVINILIVLYVMYRILYRPLGDIMRKREQFVRETLSEAARAKEEAENMIKEYSTKLEESKKEAQAIIDRAERIGEEMKQTRIQEAREEAQRLLEKAREEIEYEREQAIRSIRDEIVGMALDAAKRVVKDSVSAKEHQHLEKDFIHRVGRLQ